MLMNCKCNCNKAVLFGMQQNSLVNSTVTIINGDTANGYKKDVLFDANAVIDEIKTVVQPLTYWEIVP